MIEEIRMRLLRKMLLIVESTIVVGKFLKYWLFLLIIKTLVFDTFTLFTVFSSLPTQVADTGNIM